MRLFDISVLGWIHTLACLFALPTGFAVLALPKGTPHHRQIGRRYLISMFVGTLTAFGLYSPIEGVARGFNVFHWLAVVTLVALALAYVGARRQAKAPWAYLHPTGMVVSYYMLIGALINEVFARADTLQVFAGSPVSGLTQAANMALFLGVNLYFVVKVAVQRARLRALSPG